MSGLGGIGVALAYVASEGRVRALDFSGKAPAAAESSRFTEQTKETGPLASLVPGAVAGWLTLQERYGVLERERLLQPALHYAQSGFPVTALTNFVISESAPKLSMYETSASVLLGTDGRAPGVGTVLAMPGLARSLHLIAKGGHEAFYRGTLAAQIVSASQADGGLLSERDLADYEAEWREPVGTAYADFEVVTTAPSSCGFQILQTLKLIEGFHTRFQEPETVHALIEAAKLCTHDRVMHGADPEFSTVPLDGLLADDHVAAQRRRITPGVAAPFLGNRHRPGDGRGMTTHFAIADRDGNVVSVTQTLGAFFGSGWSAGDTGIFFNNGCYWFDSDSSGPTPIRPGDRVAFVLAPTFTFRDGNLFMSLGTTGGYGILETTPQILLNMLEFGADIQQAIDAPRFSLDEGVRVLVEERFPVELRQALSRWGHQFVEMNGGYPMGLGAAHGIVVDAERGVFQGGADPRRDGVALGW
jgi:gamma-glutamyltranspeptidase/glutathione hydrolase